MQKIILKHVIADIFAGCRDIRSDVWNKDVVFERGQNYLIEAQSGTGKSTLCSFLYGLRNDYTGTIFFDDENIAAFGTARWAKLRSDSLGILFQELRLFPELTSIENVMVKNQLTRAQTEETINAWFRDLDIIDKIDTPVGMLSYGQQQRVALIRSLCQPLDFIILDEPVSHLDDYNSGLMCDVLLDEARRQGAALISTSIGKRMKMDYDKILHL